VALDKNGGGTKVRAGMGLLYTQYSSGSPLKWEETVSGEREEGLLRIMGIMGHRHQWESVVVHYYEIEGKKGMAGRE